MHILGLKSNQKFAFILRVKHPFIEWMAAEAIWTVRKATVNQLLVYFILISLLIFIIIFNIKAALHCIIPEKPGRTS